MLYATNAASQTLAADGLVAFTTPIVFTGCTATVNGTSVNLNKPGFYRVDFVASASADAANVVINMQKNGQLISGATANGYSPAANENVMLMISAIVPVTKNDICGCNKAASGVSLTFASEAAATIANASITVNKVA